ncbi:2,3-diphosphoglycerate-dependent phosphoglycerate mutase [Rhodopirellula sp. P2]|uniref:2,3-diphosphoglycerate-dependent phosphoglycerate mutase n=1 Tax=Rhodopirellula sp. P2 TaxID=2127060 RepID=UPI0023682219|nr:2,3-diphosphoglycerate-dependent phosphoglycerate mutase [Rhodopirellula sp. P2]WDQ14920.1 2,3-diphosphoglycerate-dependent phosphoglycerate mutase [Rhodopirellula sp. P2]
MGKLILLRHGQSVWNRQNRFTGWTDVGLTDQGHQEAHEAGRTLLHDGVEIDIAFTSVLKRAIKTLWLVLETMDQMWVPVERSWRLNERHYGALQGRNKAETAKQLGEDQVLKWRRSFDVRPPLLDITDDRYPGFDRRYALLSESELPRGESLQDTIARCLPYWEATISPALMIGKTVLVVAHGNTIRALRKHLDEISDADIVGMEIPTGSPIVYDAETIREKIARV